MLRVEWREVSVVKATLLRRGRGGQALQIHIRKGLSYREHGWYSRPRPPYLG